MKKKPNILFLMSDQHRYDFTGYEGHCVKTPTLDWLAETGAKFNNCYTPSPVCVPGRQAMMAGQFPKNCDCTSFHGDLAPGYMTFAKRFTQYAYNTVCCGKLHHGGTDQMQGWKKRIGEQQQIHNSFIDNKVEEEFAKLKPKNSSYGTTLLNCLRESGMGENPVQLVDEYTELGALNFIKLLYGRAYGNTEQSEQPVMLKVSMIAPHDPYITNDYEKYQYYLNRVKPFEDEDPIEEISENVWLENIKPGVDVSHSDIRKAHAGYCAMIEKLDEQYGNVINALKHAGQDLDDWIIVYTTDHGEMLGEHNTWFKFKFYEGSVRVPLLIRAPKYFDGVKSIDENVNLCDLFATLCDFADIPTPDNLDSRSLLPLLRGDNSNWDNESISQIGGNLMIKRDDLKYMYLDNSKKEVLFDLEVNPNEDTNFINDKKYADKINAFRARKKELGY